MKYYIYPMVYFMIIIVVGAFIVANRVDIPGYGDSQIYFTLSYNDGNRLDVTDANVNPTTLNSNLDYPCINYPIDSGVAELTNPQPQNHYLVIKKPFDHDLVDTVRYDAKLAKGDQYFIEIYAVATDSFLTGTTVEIW